MGDSVLQEPNTAGRVETAPVEARVSADRSIFRIEAYENYVQNKEKIVLPRLVSSTGFVLLWIIAGVLMALGLVMAFWPVLQPTIQSYMMGAP